MVEHKSYQMSQQVKQNYFSVLRLPPAQGDEFLITMSWALKYKRVLDAVTALSLNWNTVNGLNQLKKLVREEGKYHRNNIMKFKIMTFKVTEKNSTRAATLSFIPIYIECL